MDIAFPYIPDQEPLPLFQMDIAADNPAPQTQRTLIVGQTVTAQPNVPVLVNSVARAVRLFGAGSMLASMVERYRASDPVGEVWVVPFADAGGSVASVGQLDFTGSNPTEAGTINLWIAGRYVQIPVAKADAAAAIAANVTAAVNAYVDANDFHLNKKQAGGFFRGVAMPVTAVVHGGAGPKVDLTANNKGLAGNAIDIQINYFGQAGLEGLPAGVTVAITNMVGGTGDPDMTPLDGILGDIAYDFIVHPYCTTTALDVFKTLMANDTGHWSWVRQVYGHCFTAMHDAQSGSTAATFALTRNDPHQTIVCFEASAPSVDWDVAAWFAGAFAQSSRAQPARPVQSLALPGMLAPLRNKRFTAATQMTLLNDGLALLRYSNDGTVRILRAVTTYKTDTNGSRDVSYQDTETLFTLMAVVRQQKSDALAAFPRAMLADNGTNFGPGGTFAAGASDQSIATPNSIRAVMIASYQRMINRGLVQDLKTYSASLVVQRRSTDASRVDVLSTPVLVSGLRVLAVLTNFLLQSPA